MVGRGRSARSSVHVDKSKAPIINLMIFDDGPSASRTVSDHIKYQNVDGGERPDRRTKFVCGGLGWFAIFFIKFCLF